MISFSWKSGLLAMACLLTFSACFEIEEKVKLNGDGSGTFSLVVDFSQMKEMMEEMGADWNEIQEDPFADVENYFGSERTRLEQLPGVHNPKVVKDGEGHRVGISFDFDNIQALNSGASLVFEDQEKFQHERVYYEYPRGRFIRTSEFEHALNLQNEIAQSSEEEGITGLNTTSLFADMTYTTVFEFSKPVSNMTNPNATLSNGDKTVTFEYFFFRQGYEGRRVENMISF